MLYVLWFSASKNKQRSVLEAATKNKATNISAAKIFLGSCGQLARSRQFDMVVLDYSNGYIGTAGYLVNECKQQSKKRWRKLGQNR
jgi:cytosine/adenosine deaminase-related metal-dependent hydrolase